ncbi:MAG TPA: oligosaccharide flippase family protein, partial [Solirubrobacteraceae bacterium]|nr:oligosaccharide flippase family protein [Solirubrobacteraceae bacterium]
MASVSPRTPPTGLLESETVKAAGLAGAFVVQVAFGLAFTVAITHILGADRYGSLAALISAFLILSVPGLSLQVAAAREVAQGRLGGPEELSATLAHWTHRLLFATVAAAAAAALLRHPLASLMNVRESWAAAATVPGAVLWVLLSIQRGVLQGMRAYKPLGISIVLEALGRLVFGIALAELGGGVTGAFLGMPLAIIAIALALSRVLDHRMTRPSGAGRERLRELVWGAWAPVVGLTLLVVLQQIDVILVKHQIGGSRAGAYAAAGVAAKVMFWIAVGIGLYLVPEAARRADDGRDTRPVLARALGVLAIVAVPAMLICAFAPRLVIRLAFGAQYLPAAHILVVLGGAFTLLAAAYLAV